MRSGGPELQAAVDAPNPATCRPPVSNLAQALQAHGRYPSAVDQLANALWEGREWNDGAAKTPAFQPFSACAESERSHCVKWAVAKLARMIFVAIRRLRPKVSYMIQQSDLPDTIAIFPLSGALLRAAPRGCRCTSLKPRYLQMIEDWPETPGRLNGMVQPNVVPGREGPGLQTIGCAGRITQFSLNRGRAL